jgi:hypothetical protein
MSPVRTRSQEALAQAAEDAKILAAAQAQALEEEAIGSRLPREVLNLSKAMAFQQQSVDDLKGNISKLTDMVAQLRFSIHPHEPPGSNAPGSSETSGIDASISVLRRPCLTT